MSDNLLDNTRSDFDFNAEHNGIQCAKMLNAERACDRVWLTAKQVETWSKMSTATLWRWLKRLEKAHRISRLSDLKNVTVPTATGAVTTTFYNLNVLNQLSMACIDNEKLNEISAKFSDILSVVETTGSYTTKQNALPHDYISALEALLASEKEKLATQKALEAEKEQHERDNQDFCTAVEILEQKKAQISSRREASCMNAVKQAKRETAKYKEENDVLKDQIGRGRNWRTISDLKRKWVKTFRHEPNWRSLVCFSKEVGIDPIKDVRETVNGKEVYVNRYHVSAWKLYYDLEMTLLCDQPKIISE